MPPGLTSNLVYEYKCDRCPKRYIGETRRHLDTRMREHLHGRPVPSEVTLHNHPLNKENFKIITRSNRPRLTETICLDFHKRRNSHLLNEQDSSVPLYLKLWSTTRTHTHTHTPAHLNFILLLPYKLWSVILPVILLVIFLASAWRRSFTTPKRVARLNTIF